jgi:hypothetical protein
MEIQMAGYEQKDMSGSLFKNQKKKTENHPDYTGQVLINGEQMWISAWVKESKKDGMKYFSLAFQPKDQQGQSPQRSGGGGGNFRPQSGQQSRGGQQQRGGNDRGGDRGFDKEIDDQIPFVWLLTMGLGSLLVPLAWLA